MYTLEFDVKGTKKYVHVSDEETLDFLYELLKKDKTPNRKKFKAVAVVTSVVDES